MRDIIQLGQCIIGRECVLGSGVVDFPESSRMFYFKTNRDRPLSPGQHFRESTGNFYFKTNGDRQSRIRRVKRSLEQ